MNAANAPGEPAPRPPARLASSSRFRLLPSLFMVLTVVTGIVDAVSFLALGRTFVANMTGNVVFLGFGVAGSRQVSISPSLIALGAFLTGAVAGGRLARARGRHPGWHLALASIVSLALMLAAFAVAALAVAAPGGEGRGVRDALLALAMGLQNATSRHIAVPDATTTVLTRTLTGLAADSRLAKGSGPRAGRRAASVLSMFAGAAAGGVLVVHAPLWAPILLAAGLLAALAASVGLLARGTRPDQWTRPAD